MIKFFYGAQNYFVDVTLLATDYFVSNERICIGCVISFNEIFTDVVPKVAKTLVININGATISLPEIRQNDFIFEIHPRGRLPFLSKQKDLNLPQKSYFLTYGDAKYVKSVKRICKEAYDSNYFDFVTGLNRGNLAEEFCTKFQHVLNQVFGGGFWIWKPYIIKQQLNEMQENDILVYCDAGCTVNKNGLAQFIGLISKINKSEFGIIGFDLVVHPEYRWTNEKVFEYFQIAKNDDKIRNSGQIMASIIILRKCKHVEMLIQKWYETLENDPLLFTDDYNNQHLTWDFADHRNDQSIFSILRKLYGCVLLTDNTFASDWSTLHDVPFLTTRIRE